MDETERENLAEKYPEKVKKLKVLHDQWIKKVRKEMEEYFGSRSVQSQLAVLV